MAIKMKKPFVSALLSLAVKNPTDGPITDAWEFGVKAGLPLDKLIYAIAEKLATFYFATMRPTPEEFDALMKNAGELVASLHVEVSE